MNTEQVEQRAYDFFQGGLHCAESVLAAIMEASGNPGNAVTPRMATAFGGGVGRSQEEMCGALSGGLMALGLLNGRSQAGENWDAVAASAAQYRSRFEGLCGRIRCKEVLEALGPQENMEQCKRLTARAAGLLWDLLGSQEGGGQALTCGCCSKG